MGMQAAHAAAAAALASAAAPEGDAQADGSGQPTAADGVVGMEAQVAEVMAELGMEEPAAPETARKPQAKPSPATDLWAQIQKDHAPEAVLKALDYDSNARAALAAAQQRNEDAAKKLADAEALARSAEMNMRGLQRLARKDGNAAIALLTSLDGLDDDERSEADPALIETVDEDGNKVRVRLPKQIRERLGRVDQLDQRIGNFEAHTYAQGVRGLVTQLVAEHPVFADMGVVNEVTGSLVSQIISNRQVNPDTLEQVARDAVAAAAKHSQALQDRVIQKFVKGKAVGTARSAPPMRGGGGSPPATKEPTPRLGKGTSWTDIHKLAAKVGDRLRLAGLT